MSEVDQKIFLEIISKRLTETLPQSFDINEVTKVVEILFYFLDNSVVGVRVIQENFLIIINIYIECFTVFLQHLRYVIKLQLCISEVFSINLKLKASKIYKLECEIFLFINFFFYAIYFKKYNLKKCILFF